MSSPERSYATSGAVMPTTFRSYSLSLPGGHHNDDARLDHHCNRIESRG
jgi:hypothetical protein